MREINEIAREIRKEWKRPYFAAIPYLNAMQGLSQMSDKYGYDTASSIVVYFLGNAATWRGIAARRIKAELREML